MRVKRGTVRHDNRKRILDRAEGYYGARHKLFKTAKEAVRKADAKSFVGRKERKRDYRKLWIRRISAACKLNGISYSQFRYGLKLANVELNRKGLSELAGTNPEQFKKFVELSQKAIEDSKKAA